VRPPRATHGARATSIERVFASTASDVPGAARSSTALLALVVVAALAGCGDSGTSTSPASSAPSTTTAPSTTAPPTTQAPAAQGIRAKLTASTHTPKANADWRWAVKVTDAQGRPLKVRADIEFVFAGAIVGRDTPPTRTFRGSYHDTLQWPARAAGQPLTFRVVVTTAKGRKTLDYAVMVER